MGGCSFFKSARPLELKDPFRYMAPEGDMRHQVLKRLADEIESLGLEGDIAELGVFRGRFARKIRKLFPGRTFYLFDTFEGFDDGQLALESEKFPHIKADYISQAFKDTSVEAVLAEIGDVEHSRPMEARL